MKIYFCDGCNESIPLADLESGKALTSGGKIYCGGEACAQSSLLRKSMQQSRGGGGGATIGWIGVGAAFVALALAVFAFLQASKAGGRLDELPDPGEDVAAIRTDLSGLSERMTGLEDVQSSLDDSLESVERAQAEGLKSVQGFDTRLAEVERTVRELKTLLDVLRSDREKLQTLELSRLQMEKSVSQVREAVAQIEGRLAGMRAVSPADPTDPVADADAGGGGGEAPVEFDEDTRALLLDLDSRDASVRWSAVDRLASLREPKVVPFLVPLLGDPDAFVQFRVIGTLRELNARESVGDLIGLLRDGDAIVREEALEALVSLTGNASRFDVTNGSAADREAGVRIWEDWYRENRDRFESGGS